MLEDGRLSIALLGALFGLTGAFIIDIVRYWRESEKQKHEMRLYLRLLASEVERRGRILGAGKDVQEDLDWNDAIVALSSEKSVALQQDIQGLRDVFDQFPEKILRLGANTALRVMRHYNELPALIARPEQKFAILPELRSETVNLQKDILTELDRFGPRSFFAWLTLSVRGRS